MALLGVALSRSGCLIVRGPTWGHVQNTDPGFCATHVRLTRRSVGATAGLTWTRALPPGLSPRFADQRLRVLREHARDGARARTNSQSHDLRRRCVARSPGIC